MKINMESVQMWIKSRGNFEKGIGELGSKDRIKEFQRLIRTLLPESSKDWNERSADELERASTSLSEIGKKCTDIVQFYDEDIRIIESDEFEYYHPHEWEVLPPKDGDSEIIDRYLEEIKENHKKSASYIRENKDAILRQQKAYRSIAATWAKEIRDQLESVSFIKNRKNLQSRPSGNQKGEERFVGKIVPKDKDDLYSGLSPLYIGLKDMGLIDLNTDIADIRGIFEFDEKKKKKTKKIVWTGGLGALYHFIRLLEEHEKISKDWHRKKHLILSHLFVIKKYPNYDFKKLKSNNGQYAEIDRLTIIVKDI